ncbi:hypothetical protein VCX83_22795 [Aeromonas caviae]|uniref:hypothetical protein n=1 Tax=Aeromonas TaxID=642 RepID=UPI000CD0ACC7|nr:MULTISPECIES: hypothetical protein [Aeromonas]AUV13147.1 hypothetical protein C2U39_13895 [Aeromonas sp. ASNIH3]MEA9424642.1 hypothetical protein [Aeromonas caviae]
MEWPEETLLAAYPALHVSVMEQIIEPFSSVEEARAFWDTTGCSLVIIEMTDSVSEFQAMPQHTQNQVMFGLRYPEQEFAISEDWRLLLAILNDEGAGIYLLIHSDAPLLPTLEGMHHE